MSSRIYVKPNMKVIPLEAEGLAPLSANGIRIKVPDVISEPGGMPTKPVQKTSAATSGRRNKKPAPPDQNIFGVKPPCRKSPAANSVSIWFNPQTPIRQFGD